MQSALFAVLTPEKPSEPTGLGGGVWLPSGLERRTGDRVVLGSNPTGGTLLRNFGNSV